MKNLFLLLALCGFSLAMFNSCGGSPEKKDEVAETKEKAAKEKEVREAKLSLKLDGEKIHYDNVELMYDEMFGPQLDLSAYRDSDVEDTGGMAFAQSFFGLNIEDLSEGKMETVNISMQDYITKDVQAKVNRLVIGSSMYGPVIDKINIEFTATLQDSEQNEYKLKGTYVK